MIAGILGNRNAEALTRGATRYADIDTANAFGADSMTLFGQPKTFDEEGFLTWLGKQAIGAPGSVISDLVFKHEIPLPKLADSIFETWEQMTNGVVGKDTGEQYQKPINPYEGFIKAFGLRPASSSRPWEGGSASQNIEAKKQRGHRREALRDAAHAKGGERLAVIRAWNREHPDDRINYSDVQKSVRRREQNRKEREKADAQFD